MNIEVANRLAELRKKNGLSQEELAERLGLSRQAVSKWERAESSPDTDNLICLARLYNVSLDDLLNTEQPIDDIVRGVKEKDEEKKDMIVLKSGDGSRIEISAIDENEDFDNEKEKSVIETIIDSITPILCVACYLTIGFTTAWGWSKGWLVFLLIPLVSSTFSAIKRRRFCRFAYPVLVSMLYLSAGLFLGRWSPEWVLFITIPVYYIIFSEIDKTIHRGKNDIDDEDDEDE